MFAFLGTVSCYFKNQNQNQTKQHKNKQQNSQIKIQ